MNRKRDRIFFISIIISILFILTPILFRIDLFENIATYFFGSLKMREYKTSYIEALGGMIGTFLAVSGALYANRQSSINDKIEEQKKSAVIVYYDIKLFYKENDVFASRIDRLLKTKKEEKKILEEFNKLREYYAIHIDNDWIKTVASLIGSLDDTDIQTIYSFYGKITELKLKLENDQDFKIEDIRLIRSIFYTVGEKVSYYKPNEEIQNILEKLQNIKNKNSL